MNRDQAEAFIDTWELLLPFTMIYNIGLFNKETLIINREYKNYFTVNSEYSTISAGPWDKRDMIDMLTSGQLEIPKELMSVHRNYKYERTGGCTCYVWKTGGKHADWCAKNNSPKGGSDRSGWPY